MAGLFSRKKLDSAERDKAIKIVIEETDKQLEELKSKVDGIPHLEHKKKVMDYIEKLERRRRRLEDGTFYK